MVTNGVATNGGVLYNPQILGSTSAGGLSSNVTFNSATFAPTNIYLSKATASLTNGNIFVKLSSVAGLHRGDNMAFGNAQFVITDITNANNTVTVFPAVTFTSNNVNFIVYPDAQYWEDINGNPAGFMANDGSVGIVGESPNANSGALYFLNGANTMQVVGGVDGIGGYLTFNSPYSSLGPNGLMFRVYQRAIYDTLVVLPDSRLGGLVSVRGLTNMQGQSIPFFSQIQANNGATMSSLVVTNAPTFQTTNASPSNVSVGSNTPDIWLTITNNGTAYFVPGWRSH